MILLSLKFFPLHNHQGRGVFCWEGRNTPYVHTQAHTQAYVYAFIYVFNSIFILEEVTIQQEWMLSKHKPCVKYSNGALFTKAGEFLFSCRHMFVMWYIRRGSSNSRDLIHRYYAHSGIFL